MGLTKVPTWVKWFCIGGAACFAGLIHVPGFGEIAFYIHLTFILLFLLLIVGDR